jgi:hypothetical protein
LKLKGFFGCGGVAEITQLNCDNFSSLKMFRFVDAVVPPVSAGSESAISVIRGLLRPGEKELVN